MLTGFAGRAEFKVAANERCAGTAGAWELFAIKEFAVEWGAGRHPFKSTLGTRDKLVFFGTTLGASLVGHGLSQGWMGGCSRTTQGHIGCKSTTGCLPQPLY